MTALIKKNKYDELVNNIVYICFFIHLMFFSFGRSELASQISFFMQLANNMKIISFMIMCFSLPYYFLRGKFSLKEIIIYIIIAIPLLISYRNYPVIMVAANLLYIPIFKNVNANKALKVALYATITGFLINLLISIFTKYTGNQIQTRYFGNERIRYGLGFYYGYITAYFYSTIILIYILTKKNIKYIEYAILMIFNIMVFIFCDTRSAFFYGMLAILLHILFVKINFKEIDIKLKKIIEKVFNLIVLSSFLIASILAIFLPVIYIETNPILIKINKIVSGRLFLTREALKICGWKWFGQYPKIGEAGKFYPDSSIASMLIQNGMVVLIMSIIFMTIFSYMAIKTKNKSLIIVLFVIAIRSIFDMGFMCIQLGPVVVLFYTVLDSYLKLKKSKNFSYMF